MRTVCFFALLSLSVLFFACHQSDVKTLSGVDVRTHQKIKEKLEPNNYRMYKTFGGTPTIEETRAYFAAKEQINAALNLRGPQAFEDPWTYEGPGNIGAKINTLAIDPKDDNTIYLGYNGGGLFKTIDGGTNWEPIFDDQPSLTISKVVVDPNDSNILYVGTGEPDISGYLVLGAGLFKSTDGGNSWQSLNFQDRTIITDISLNKEKPEEIVISTMGNPIIKDEDRGIYKSTDGGNTWVKTLFVDVDAGVIDLEQHSVNSNILIASSWNRYRTNYVSEVSGDDARIYYSTDFGTTWTPASFDYKEYMSRIGLSFSTVNPDDAYAVFVGPNQQIHSIHKSVDAGKSWSVMDIDFEPVNNVFGGFGWYFGRIKVLFDTITKREYLYVLGVDMFRYDMTMKEWKMVTPPWYYYEVHADKHDLHLTSDNQMILATDGGAYKSGFDHDWTDIENIITTQFYRVKVNPHVDKAYYGGAQDNGTSFGSNNNQLNWESVYGGDGFQTDFIPTDDKYAFYETQNGNVVMAYNKDGEIEYNSITASIWERKNWDAPYMINPNNPFEILFGSYRLLRGTIVDQNVTWDTITPDLTTGIVDGELRKTVSGLDYSTINKELIYSCTSDGNVWRHENDVHTAINNGIPKQYITSIKASPNIEDHVYVTVSGYKYNEFEPKVYQSTDKGEQWEPIHANLPEAVIHDIYVYPAHNDSILFVATDFGVYGTINQGKEWHRIGNNMPLIACFDIDLDVKNKRLVVATFARGIVSYDINPILDAFKEQVSTKKDAHSTAIRVYPNPANNFIYIDGLDNSKSIRFEFFHQNGHLVEVEHQASYQKNRVNISNLDPGLYFIYVYENGIPKQTLKFVKQ